jgi:prevent-host-death family protein
VPEFEVAVAQARLDELIDRALAGEEIVVTSDGVPLAVLEPLRKQPEQPTSASAR